MVPSGTEHFQHEYTNTERMYITMSNSQYSIHIT